MEHDPEDCDYDRNSRARCDNRQLILFVGEGASVKGDIRFTEKTEQLHLCSVINRAIRRKKTANSLFVRRKVVFLQKT